MPGLKYTRTHTHTKESDYSKSQDTVYVRGGKKVKSRVGHRKGASRVTGKVIFLDFLVSPYI